MMTFVKINVGTFLKAVFWLCLAICFFFATYGHSVWNLLAVFCLMYLAVSGGFSLGAAQADGVINEWMLCKIEVLPLQDGDIVKVSFPPDMPAVNRQQMLDRLAEMVQRSCVGGHVCVIDAASVDVTKSNEAGPV